MSSLDDILDFLDDAVVVEVAVVGLELPGDEVNGDIMTTWGSKSLGRYDMNSNCEHIFYYLMATTSKISVLKRI